MASDDVKIIDTGEGELVVEGWPIGSGGGVAYVPPVVVEALRAYFAAGRVPEDAKEPEYKLPGYDEVLDKLNRLTIRGGSDAIK